MLEENGGTSVRAGMSGAETLSAAKEGPPPPSAGGLAEVEQASALTATASEGRKCGFNENLFLE